MMTAENVFLGSLVKTVGLKGEVKLLPSADFWTGSLRSVELILVLRGEGSRTVRVERFRSKGNTYILKIPGIDSIEDAGSIVGGRLEMPRKSIDETNGPSELKPFQAMGLDVVLPDRSVLGKVVDFLLGPAHGNLIVEHGGEKLIIPVVPEIVKTVDLANRLIIVDPPEGLLDLRW